jgi:hypothetical protein
VHDCVPSRFVVKNEGSVAAAPDYHTSCAIYTGIYCMISLL